MTPVPEILTRSLGKTYRTGQPVLKGIDFVVHRRERVALIGANGSGKSTLLKSVIGLHPVTSGRVTALGESFELAPSPAQKRRLRQQIGFVSQHHALVRRLSVLSNVVHGMLGRPGSWRASIQSTARADWRDSAMTALEAVGLHDRPLARADSLSGGQQQRVAIARALVRQPRLMIADEPAASLDPAAGRDVMELFSNLARDFGITLLFTTHDMEHALRFSDRIVALKAGRVHFDAASRDVSDAMLHEVFHG